MEIDAILNKVKDFADKAHGNQMRRYTPERYIVHPERVMQTCRAYTNDITILSAALLHDVLEDTPIKKEELREFLLNLMSEKEANKTVQLVEELTDIYIKENYPYWNRKKRKLMEARRLEKTSAAAQTIKYADIIDNAPEVTEQEPDFAKKFIPEYDNLLRKITKGNSILYEKANQVVNTCMLKLNEAEI